MSQPDELAELRAQVAALTAERDALREHERAVAVCAGVVSYSSCCGPAKEGYDEPGPRDQVLARVEELRSLRARADGCEAEELRSGVERLMAEAHPAGRGPHPKLVPMVSVDELQALLDRVDARDSLAILTELDALRARVALYAERGEEHEKLDVSGERQEYEWQLSQLRDRVEELEAERDTLRIRGVKLGEMAAERCDAELRSSVNAYEEEVCQLSVEANTLRARVAELEHGEVLRLDAIRELAKLRVEVPNMRERIKELELRGLGVETPPVVPSGYEVRKADFYDEDGNEPRWELRVTDVENEPIVVAYVEERLIRSPHTIAEPFEVLAALAWAAKNDRRPPHEGES